MDYDFSEQLDRARRWAQTAGAEGWLPDEAIEAITAVEVRSPASLFAAGEQRPLVVAFFGGTGVGKSSLLNRLAGQTIARVGVERPTSREISMYHHESLRIDRLPAEFPVDKIRVARHQNEEGRGILWIDMPDIDSTEAKNRSIVLEWLPHIDVLIYVVSPERYRDAREWQLLRSCGNRHAWIFVMNRWDEGDQVQLDDLARELGRAGFERPIILRTDCRPDPTGRAADDFLQLEETIRKLADAHTISQLELRGLQLRLQTLEQALEAAIGKLGSDDAVIGLKKQWNSLWNQTVDSLQQGLEWPMQQVAATFVSQSVSLLPSRSKPQKSGSDESEPVERNRPIGMLWDEWTQTRFDDTLDRVVIEANAKGLPSTPFKHVFESIRSTAGATFRSQAEQSLRAALANPGNALQRFFLRCAGLGSKLLPLCAIGWVGYQVYDGYYTSSFSDRPYLGTDFAIHSTLLIVISWLLPWFVYRTLRPSTEKAALKGIRNGVGLGFDLLKEQIDAQIDQVLERRSTVLAEGRKQLARCRRMEAPAETPGDESVLSRMVPTPGRSLSARTNERH